MYHLFLVLASIEAIYRLAIEFNATKIIFDIILLAHCCRCSTFDRLPKHHIRERRKIKKAAKNKEDKRNPELQWKELLFAVCSECIFNFIMWEILKVLLNMWMRKCNNIPCFLCSHYMCVQCAPCWSGEHWTVFEFGFALKKTIKLNNNLNRIVYCP